MRTIPRLMLAVGSVAALSMTISPVSAQATSPTAAGSVAVAQHHWDDDGYGDGYDEWDDDGYGDGYYGDGYYCVDCDDDMPLICRKERYSCRAPRDWSVHPVDGSVKFGR